MVHVPKGPTTTGALVVAGGGATGGGAGGNVGGMVGGIVGGIVGGWVTITVVVVVVVVVLDESSRRTRGMRRTSSSNGMRHKQGLQPGRKPVKLYVPAPRPT